MNLIPVWGHWQYLAASTGAIFLVAGLMACWRAYSPKTLGKMAQNSLTLRFGLSPYRADRVRVVASGLLLRLLGLGLFGFWVLSLPGPEIPFTVAGALLIWGADLLSRVWATTSPETFLRVSALPAGILLWIFHGPARILFWIPGFRKTLEFSAGTAPSAVTEDQIRMLIRAGGRSGALERDEARLLESIFRFGDRIVREVMVPRNKIVALEVGTPVEKVLEVFSSSGYSRLPVYEKELDRIRGVAYAKDFLTLFTHRKLILLQDILRPVTRVRETKEINDLLSEFRRKRIQFALVTDEYGGVEGLVTLEDMIEEIVGEIRDEYDVQEEDEIRKNPDHSLRVLGHARMEDLEEALGVTLPPRPEVETVGGYLMDHLGEVPHSGQVIRIAGTRWKVDRVRANEVLALTIRGD